MTEWSNIIVFKVRVIPIVDRYVPDALVRKINLGIIAGLDVVPSKPGLILRYDHVDISAVNVIQHPLKIRAVVIQPGVAIVHIEVMYKKTLLPAIVFQNVPLGLDTGAFAHLTVIIFT